METKRKIELIREGVLSDIKNLLGRYNLTGVNSYDIDEGCSPIIMEDEFDDNNTYVLDFLSIKNGKLSFEGSNCSGEYIWSEETIPTDALVDISDWLEEHTDELEELVE